MGMILESPQVFRLYVAVESVTATLHHDGHRTAQVIENVSEIMHVVTFRIKVVNKRAER